MHIFLEALVVPVNVLKPAGARDSEDQEEVFAYRAAMQGVRVPQLAILTPRRAPAARARPRGSQKHGRSQ
jgi:hypothetical protein